MNSIKTKQYLCILNRQLKSEMLVAQDRKQLLLCKVMMKLAPKLFTFNLARPPLGSHISCYYSIKNKNDTILMEFQPTSGDASLCERKCVVDKKNELTNA